MQSDLGLLFKSVKYTLFFTSPIYCGKWSQKKSEYSNLEMLYQVVSLDHCKNLSAFKILEFVWS